MKALVADADRISRAVMKRLLSHIDVETVEADNGLTALALLEEADPDFLVLDGELPILSGLEALSAIRRSPLRPDVPVICVSASGDRDTVRRMIELDIADYLLKPIHPVEALPRIKAVMAQAARWRQASAAGGHASVMLVDADPNFLAFARPLLEPSCDVWDVSSSKQAALRFREARVKPSIVCLSEGLPLMNEDVLADVIRKMAVQDGAVPPQIFLLSSEETVSEPKRARYAGVMRKSFVPAQFAEEFRRIVLAEISGLEKLRRVVRDDLRGELVTAVQQTIGVMMGMDVSVRDDAADGEPSPSGVRSRVVLDAEGKGYALLVDLVTGRAEAEAIGTKVLRHAVTFDEGGAETMGELANTISGRLRACLLSRDIDLKIGLPQIGEEEGEAAPEDLGLGFRCSCGHGFAVRLRVRQEQSPLATAAPATGSAPAEGEAAPAPAPPAEASVDSVLF